MKNQVRSQNELDHALLDVLFNSTQNGVVIIDAVTHKILEVNNVALHLIGFPKDEVIGKLCHHFICPNRTGNCPIRDRGITVDNAECVLLGRNEKIIPILKTVVATTVDDKELYIESFTDITALKESEKENLKLIHDLEGALNQIKSMTDAELAKENEVKRDLVAAVSHEIRTPLNGIIGMNHILAGTSLSQEQRECVTIIENSAKHLLEVLNSVLDYTKIDAGQRKLEKIVFNLQELLQDVCSVFHHFEHTHLTFNCNLNKLDEHWVSGDPTAIKQILFNLLNNAFKFSPKGKIELRVSFTSNELYISVSDTGIGIPEDKQHLIFEPYKQADDSKTRVYGGTGLGLSVTKALISQMGGTIDLVSELGVGTCFNLTLPLEEREKQNSDSKNRRSEEDIKDVTVLVVDDNSINLKVAGRLITQLGCTVEYAFDGLEAVEKAREKEYDIIFMDIMMPVMNGEDAAREIRKLKNYKKTPLIALTAEAVGVSRYYYKQFGFCDYISKPVNIEILREILYRFLSHEKSILCPNCPNCIHNSL